MRIYILLFFITGIFSHSQAQTITDTIVYIENDTINSLDVKPEFPGGEVAFEKFLSTRLIYPEDAKKKNIQGTTYIEFIVEKDGSLSNFKVVDGKSVCPSIDQAVINVLLKSPRWKPGLKNGQPIRVRRIKKTKFVLN